MSKGTPPANKRTVVIVPVVFLTAMLIAIAVSASFRNDGCDVMQMPFIPPLIDAVRREPPEKQAHGSVPKRLKVFKKIVPRFDDCWSIYKDAQRSHWWKKAYMVSGVSCQRSKEFDGTRAYLFPFTVRDPAKLKDPRVVSAIFTSFFGYRRHPVIGKRRLHEGVDIRGYTGEPVLAMADGIILASGMNNGCGNQVRVRHTDGVVANYCHFSEIPGTIKKGAKVARGEVVGYVGETGNTSGPHAHIELEEDGKQFNPLDTSKVVWDFAEFEGEEVSALDRAIIKLNL